MLVVTLAAVIAAGAWATVALLPLGDRTPGGDRDAAGAGVPARQSTLVFATYDQDDPSAGASLVFVLAAGDGEPGTLLLVPPDTVADVPGHGLDRLGQSFAYGRGPLLDATLDNLLGTDFPGVAAVSRQGWAALFDRAGGLTVEVPERLVAPTVDGGGQVRFEPGTQHLDGARLAELMTFSVPGEGPLASLGRARLVLEALLVEVGRDPALLDAVFADGAPMVDSPVPAEDVRALLAAAAGSRTADRLDVLSLPVSPLGAGQLRVDRDRVTELVADRFPGSVPGTAAAGRRLQILNGNGRPGIGAEVAGRLVPAGFTVVLTDNADRFDHPRTRIVVYDDSAEQLAIAREVRDLLGVGAVELNRAPQSVVDVTIVVGRDFLDTLR